MQRLTLSILAGTESARHYTFVPTAEGVKVDRGLHGLHPEVADRLGLSRLAEFELERLASTGEVVCFACRSRTVPSDERIVVLAEVRGRTPEGRDGAAVGLRSLERVLFAATAALRSALGTRDPRRRLQCNRIALFVTPTHPLEREGTEALGRRLAPAVRHLGLEKIVVRCHLRDSDRAAVVGSTAEMIIEEIAGSLTKISWRASSHAPLQPASDYQRKVALTRRRGVLYPYEILRMLTDCSGRAAVSEVIGLRDLPASRFVEYDLDPSGSTSRAVLVAGRPFGSNTSSVVFGVISTSTEKVPDGVKRVLVLSDPTLARGSLTGGECERMIAAIDLAEDLSIPVEWIPVSSGARIAMESGTENLDAAASVARRIVEFTQADGVIHLIVQGVNAGAQSCFDALSAMLMHTRGAIIMTPRGAMVLGEQAAREASDEVAGDGEVAIGGFERSMGPNGESDYYALDLVDAYRILYEHYRFTYIAPGETRPGRHPTTDSTTRDISTFPYTADVEHGFDRVGQIFDEGMNPGRKRPFAMRTLMRAVIDQDGSSLERWRSMADAETAIIWDAHLGGNAVCLIGIESCNTPREGNPPLDGPSSWTGGTLFPMSSKKVARALNTASGIRPVVVLANLSGFDGSPESMRNQQLEHGAEIARAVVNFRGTILFLVVSRYHGGAYVVFSRALNEGVRASAVEGSYASVIGGAPAAAVVFRREVRARASADPRIQKMQAALERDPSSEAQQAFEELHRSVLLAKQAEVATEFDAIHDVERALEVGSLEAIVAVSDVRAHLIRQLEDAPRVEVRPKLRHRTVGQTRTEPR